MKERQENIRKTDREKERCRRKVKITIVITIFRVIDFRESLCQACKISQHLLYVMKSHTKTHCKQ